MSRYPHSDMDRALEHLSFSYLDNIPFCVDPRLEEANVDLSVAIQLLSREPPSVSGISLIDLSEMGQLEHQFLKQLEEIEAEKKKKKEEDEKEISEYLEMKRQKEEEKKKEEETKKVIEEQEEKKRKEDESTEEETKVENGDNPVEERPVDPHVEEFQQGNPNASNVYLIPKQNVASYSKDDSLTRPSKINYSEFEAESDPFERAELQTLDDLGILASVLQTTSISNVSTVAPSFVAASATNTMTTPSLGQSQHAGMFYPPPNQPQFYPHMNYHGMGAQMPHFQHMHFQPRPTIPVPGHQGIHQPSWGTSSSSANTTTFPSPMKSSKSFGDILSEMKKEESLQAENNLTNDLRASHRKVSSQTPPPRPVTYKQPNARANMLDDWIPWPDLDDHSRHERLSPNKSFSNLPARQTEDNSERLLQGLSPTSASVCRQMQDMGFPLSRVAKVCQALGDDQQQMINFCLLVDKLVESESVKSEQVETALLLYSVNEEKTVKHLKVFKKISELGFKPESIHEALITCELDYEKTVESLLK